MKGSASKQCLIWCSNGRFRSILLTRKEAIKCFCVECLGFSESPENCPSKTCPLHPFRGGTTINKKGDLDIDIYGRIGVKNA
jgi:hypothetical protein